MGIKDKIILFFMLYGAIPDCTSRSLSVEYLDELIDGYDLEIEEDYLQNKINIVVEKNDQTTR
jgi:hypothetical protein